MPAQTAPAGSAVRKLRRPHAPEIPRPVRHAAGHGRQATDPQRVAGQRQLRGRNRQAQVRLDGIRCQLPAFPSAPPSPGQAGRKPPSLIHCARLDLGQLLAGPAPPESARCETRHAAPAQGLRISRPPAEFLAPRPRSCTWTQPAVSTQVRKLESHAGNELFEQFGKKIYPDGRRQPSCWESAAASSSSSRNAEYAMTAVPGRQRRQAQRGRDQRRRLFLPAAFGRVRRPAQRRCLELHRAQPRRSADTYRRQPDRTWP